MSETVAESTAFARRYIESITDYLQKLDLGVIAQVIQILEHAWADQCQVFIAGNGGSAATASHMATDLSKTVCGSSATARGFRAIALTDNMPLLTAWANDVGYEEVFAGQLRVLAQPGDILIVISGSGQSANVVRVVQVAREMKLVTIGLLGRGGGLLKSLVDVAVIVPAEDYGPIEDVHLMLDHLITSYFKAWLEGRR